MTVRTSVQGSGREIAGEATTGRELPGAQTGGTAHADERGQHAPNAADDRCSPDPCQHTDRYRLVTPFSLRL